MGEKRKGIGEREGGRVKRMGMAHPLFSAEKLQCRLRPS